MRSFRPSGELLWFLSTQYYIVQLVVAAAWPKNSGYSWANNTISDLGNTHCGQYGSRLVCSPLHGLMNGSFICLGLTMIGGAWLLNRYFASRRVVRLGFGTMALAGLGTILVGLFPENTVSGLHITGAALAFTFGNIGVIVVGFGIKKLPGWLRVFSLLLGAVGLVALVLFMMKTYLGLGIGGMERLVGYPQSIWMMVLGAYWLVVHRETQTD